MIRRLKWPLIIIVALLLVPPVEVAVVAAIDPPRTLPMILHQAAGSLSGRRDSRVLYRWVDLREISPVFLKHVWISEDQRFFEHNGFDWREIDIAIERSETRGTPVRGASTITMQCARSIFLWQGRSWIRKGLESYYTIWMEALLSKRRILELYANVIEFGPGIYGIEAASRHNFGVSGADLTPEQSALLAAVLPNPKGWNPKRPGAILRRRQQRILRREQSSDFPQHLLR